MATSIVQTQQLYDGLLIPAASDIQMDLSSDLPSAKPKRTTQKKQSKATKIDDDSKKAGKRGRPRVDTQNENAVERRRTQIRLAQRAYRERKETAISALEDQVSRLQQTISTMNELFTDFHALAFQSGITASNPALGDSLRTTMDGMLQLVQDSSIDGENDDRTKKDSRKRRRSSENTTDLGDTISKDFDDMDFDPTTNTSPLEGQQLVDSDCPLGYRLLYDDERASTTNPTNSVAEDQQQILPLDQTITSDWMETPKNLQRAHLSILNSPSFTENWMFSAPSQHLRPVFTYSFQESSFARRLLRDSYERTYHLLTSRSPPPPEKLHEIFKYALCFGNLNTITNKIKEILSRSAQEPLGVWELPTLHIGGAGLHFPRTDNSEAPPIQGWNTERNVGPFAINRGQTPPPAQFFPYDVDVFKGIEGIWFDSHDVEQYLKTKGLFLTGSCSVAEIEVDDSSILSASSAGTPQSGSTETVSGPHSPNAPPGQVTEFFSPSVDYLLSKVAADDLSSTAGFEFDFTLFQSADADKGNGELEAAPVNMFGELPAFDVKTPQRRKVTIDVDKLLDALNSRAICLGRAPGYRQTDVDAALSNVLLEAW